MTSPRWTICSKPEGRELAVVHGPEILPGQSVVVVSEARVAEAERERDENEGVIKVWRRRAEEAEAENKQRRAEIRAEHKWKADQAGSPCQCEICAPKHPEDEA